MKYWFLSLIILSLILTACASPSSDADTTAQNEPQPTQEPFPAWDFTMQSLGGETYTLSDLRGQWVMLNFWATWCGPCVDEMPALQQIARENSEDVLLLGINFHESADDVQTFVEQNRLTFPMLINPTDGMIADYSVQGLPQTVLIDPEGRLVWRKFGPIDFDTFNEELVQFIQG